MSEFEKRPDQAENLRTKMIDDYKELHGDYPPRGEVHKDKEKKTKLKMKYPIISLLALFFILMPLLFLSITFYYGNGGNQSANGKNSSGNETVFISNEQTDEEQNIDPLEEEKSISIVEEESSTEEIEVKEVKEVNSETSEADSVDKSNESIDQNGQEIQQSQTNGSTESPSKKTESEKSNESEYREVKTHRVAAGETLFNISVRYYNSRSGEEIIRQYNGLEANNIYEGQILKIPLK